jgi:Flp pilus assembly protein TadB
MLVVNKNGKTTVITGWRAWALGALVALGLIVVFYVVLFFMLGIAVTLGVVLAIAVPVLVLGALISSALQRNGPR